MNIAMGREKYLTIALTLAALLLTGVLLWEWNQGLQLQRELLKMRNIPVVSAKPLNILPEFSLPPLEAGFPEFISRSLFSLNRRSSAVAGKGSIAAMKKGQFVLVGVLITPQRSSAQLRDVQTNKAESVALNGVIRGMTVGEIGPSKVVLQQGTESEELILNVQTGGKGAASVRAPAAVAPVTAAAAPPVQPSSAASAPARAASAVATPASAPARVASGAATPASAPGQAAPPNPDSRKQK
jgi:hypothetical protein